MATSPNSEYKITNVKATSKKLISGMHLKVAVAFKYNKTQIQFTLHFKIMNKQRK